MNVQTLQGSPFSFRRGYADARGFKEPSRMFSGQDQLDYLSGWLCGSASNFREIVEQISILRSLPSLEKH